MSILKILQTIDKEFKYSSILNYQSHILFWELIKFDNSELLKYRDNCTHLVNQALIIKNDILVPKYLQGKPKLISNYLKLKLSD